MIAIKKMESLPDNCLDCPLSKVATSGWLSCPYGSEYRIRSDIDGRAVFCPLVEVQDVGND